MTVIDFHNHYYPPKYMRALQSGQSSVRVTIDSDGNPNIHYPGDYNVAVRGTATSRIAGGARRHGVTMRSYADPGAHVESGDRRAARVARQHEFKEAMDTRADRFTALATCRSTIRRRR
jgi:aminocarboxymuconate-semialdehyde decarboxylase